MNQPTDNREAPIPTVVPHRFSCLFTRGNGREYLRYGCYFPAEDQSVWENGQISRGYPSSAEWIDPLHASASASEPPRRGPKPTIEPDRTQPPSEPSPSPANGKAERTRVNNPKPAGPPTNGKALYAWAKDQEQEYNVGLVKYLNQWGKLQTYPGRIVDWTPDQAAAGHREASRKLATIGKEKEQGRAGSCSP